MIQRASLAVALSFLLVPSFANAVEVIVNLRSGNGLAGGTDSLIHMLVGPADGPFGGVITSSMFDAARGGPAPFITSPIHGDWKQTPLAADSAAQWISTGLMGTLHNDTALYAIDFDLPTDTILSGMLDFNFLVDNYLGDDLNQGVFINRMPVPGTQAIDTSHPNFIEDQSFLGLDVTSLLNPGINTLFIYANDEFGPSALQFAATFTVETQDPPPPIVPEPQSLAIWSLVGVLGFAAYRRRRKAD